MAAIYFFVGCDLSLVTAASLLMVTSVLGVLSSSMNKYNHVIGPCCISDLFICRQKTRENEMR